MATEIGDSFTSLDLVRRLDPNGSIADLVESMAQSNEIHDDIPWIECNNGTGHLTSVRTGYPSGTWRKLYGGVLPGKSTAKQVMETTGMLEAYSEIDKSLADINNNSAKWRLSEERGYTEGLNQDLAYGIFYNDTAIDPEKILGLGPRFDTPTADEDQVGSQIIDGGGSNSDNTSLWLIVWGPDTVHGLYPKGSKMGLVIEDKGQVTVGDATNGYYEAYRTHYKWDVGFCVRNWKAIVRIANLDISNLATAGADTDVSANLMNLMLEAEDRIPTRLYALGKPVWYGNKRVRTALKKQLLNRANTLIALEQLTGTGGIIRPTKTLTFDGIPLRQVDKIGIAEAALTGTFWS